MELKTTSTIKKKDRLVKNLKARFREGIVEEEEDEEVDDDEDEQGQGPLALTQGMGEDAKEEEGAKYKAAKVEPKKRKA